MPEIELASGSLGESLLIVEPTNLRFYYTTFPPGRRRLRASFLQGGQPYDLVMTDPAFKAVAGNMSDDVPLSADSIIPGGRFFLTVSLAEPWNGACFKLVAGVVALTLE